MTLTDALRVRGRRMLTAVAGVAIATGLAFGSAAVAHADVLDDLAQEYAVGAGGGQVSNLLKSSLKLRAMGIKPSKHYYEEIQAAMNYRPNQMPLIEALKDTIAYQQKIKSQMEILQQAQSQNANNAVMGAGQMPAAGNPNQFGSAMGGSQLPAASAPAAQVPAASAPAAQVPAASAPAAEVPMQPTAPSP